MKIMYYLCATIKNTIMKNEVIESLLKCEFSVKETLSQLQFDKPMFWSWGAHNFINIKNKGLLFKVNGHHHKGYVLITLDWTDTYTVHIISTHGNILNTYDMVYFDELETIIDNRIERIPQYE